MKALCVIGASFAGHDKKRTPHLGPPPPMHSKVPEFWGVQPSAESFFLFSGVSLLLTPPPPKKKARKGGSAPRSVATLGGREESDGYLTNLAILVTNRVPPDVGLAPSAAWRPLRSTPLRPRTLPPTSLGRPLPEPCKKSQGGWGEEGRRGRGGKGFGLREGSSNYNGGWGGPSKHQLGPDPHLGAPKPMGFERTLSY